MSEIAGLWVTELSSIVSNLKVGDSANVENRLKNRVVVRVEPVDVGRCGENDD